MDHNDEDFWMSTDPASVKKREDWFNKHTEEVAAQNNANTATPDSRDLKAILAFLVTSAKTSAEAAAAAIAEPRAHNPQKIGLIPAKFKGDHDDTQRFLMLFRLYINSNKSVYNTNEKSLHLTYGLMEGKAGEWIQPYIEASIALQDAGFDNEPADAGTFAIVDYDDFIKKFEATWFPADPGNVARNKIDGLKQGTTSVTEYSTEFMSHAARTGYSMVDLRFRYRRGLADYI